MVAVGTGATTGITIWVVADGRWQPKNFPTFTITDPEIAWDWVTSSSNYESLRLSKEAGFGGRGWQIESSLELNQYTISQTLEQAIQYGSSSVGGYTAPIPPPAVDGGASDAGAIDGGDGTEDAGVDGGLAAAEADLAVLFAGISQPSVRFTRMRSDVAKSALSVDMALEASTDQSELTNQHNPGQQIGEPECPVYDSNCEVTGTAPRSEAAASSAVGGSGCTTTRPARESESSGATGILIVLAGLTLVRAQKKRRDARSSS
jgi:hypothetical protein